MDAFDRIHAVVHGVVEGLDDDQLCYRPTTDANSIAWLVWHLTRIEDDHVAGLADAEQTWTASGWVDRFALPFDPGATGYGQRSAEVAAVRVGADDLLGYHDAVQERRGSSSRRSTPARSTASSTDRGTRRSRPGSGS